MPTAGLVSSRVAAAIREAAPRNTIIATGPNFSDIADLLTQHPSATQRDLQLPLLRSPRVQPPGSNLGHLLVALHPRHPLPAHRSRHAADPPAGPDPASRSSLERYFLDHWDAHRIRLTIDEAAAWGQANHVPLLCNEFGVFREKSDPASRNAWIHDVRIALESDHIGWAMWTITALRRCAQAER